MRLGAFLRPSAAEYTAGRYGAGGSLGPAVSDVLHASPWYGFGAGGLATAYDSLWVQVLVLADVAGVVFAAVALLMLAFRLWCLRGVTRPAEWRLAGAVLVLAVAASLRLPSLTANRDATLLWLVLGILIAAQPRAGARPVSSGGRALTAETDEPLQIRPASDRKVIITRADPRRPTPAASARSAARGRRRQPGHKP